MKDALDFKKKYEEFGIRVAVSSRDHREYDRVIEEGKFGIAIIVYEKMAPEAPGSRYRPLPRVEA